MVALRWDDHDRLHRLARLTMLATVVCDPAVLDRARHDVKKTLSDLLTLA